MMFGMIVSDIISDTRSILLTLLAGIIFPSCLQGGQNGGRGVTSICHLECILLLEAASMNHSPFASSFPEAIPAQGPYFRAKITLGENLL